MTAFVPSLKSVGSWGLHLLVKLRFVLIGLLVLGIGIWVGQSITSIEQGELALSIITMIVLLVITLQKPLNGLVIWILCLPFLESLINIPMGAGIPDLSFSRFLIAYMGIAMLARATVGRDRVQRISPAEICILATTVGIMLAAPRSISPDTKGVIQMSLAWHLQPMLAFFFAKNLVKDHDDLVKVFFIIGLLGAFSGAYAAYEHATGNVLFLPRGRSLADLALYRSDLGIRMIRGIYGGTGTMGRVLVLSIPGTFYLYLEPDKHRIPRLLLMSMLAFQFYGSYVAMSRTPWYALLIALFVMQLIYPKFRRIFLVIALVAALVLFATWDQVTKSTIASRVGDENSTLEGRQTRWTAGWNMWQARPIGGWGFGHYGNESGRFRTDDSSTHMQAIENDYLLILISAGLVGIVPYLLSLALPFLTSLRLSLRIRSPHWPGYINQGTIAAYWAVLTIFAICSYTATIVDPTVKQLAFAVAGTVVGTHASYLQRRRPSPSRAGQASSDLPSLNLDAGSDDTTCDPRSPKATGPDDSTPDEASGAPRNARRTRPL